LEGREISYIEVEKNMKIGKKKSTLFETEKNPRNKRQKYLEFKNVCCSEIFIPNSTHLCTYCKKKMTAGEKAYHVKAFKTHNFSVFMCIKCVGIFQKGEMKI
jgi:hypothetical protein